MDEELDNVTGGISILKRSLGFHTHIKAVVINNPLLELKN